MSARAIATEAAAPTAVADIAPTTAGQQRLTLFLLTLVLALNQADRNILLIVLEPVKQAFGLSDSQVGMLSGLTFGLTNPKGYPVAIAMFTALLSSSADTLSWSALPMLLAAACAGFIIADIILVFFVGTGWVRRFYARYDLWIARASGLIFIGFGLHAIYEALPGLAGRRS